jgi:hypothetical protein
MSSASASMKNNPALAAESAHEYGLFYVDEKRFYLPKKPC